MQMQNKEPTHFRSFQTIHVHISGRFRRLLQNFGSLTLGFGGNVYIYNQKVRSEPDFVRATGRNLLIAICSNDNYNIGDNLYGREKISDRLERKNEVKSDRSDLILAPNPKIRYLIFGNVGTVQNITQLHRHTNTSQGQY